MDLDDDGSGDHSAVSREGETASNNSTTNTNPRTSSPEKNQTSKQWHADHTVNLTISTLDDKGTIYELPPVSFPATPYPIPNPRDFILANFGILVNPQPQQPSVGSTTIAPNKRP
mgnify:CR=1 FL=1